MRSCTEKVLGKVRVGEIMGDLRMDPAVCGLGFIESLSELLMPGEVVVGNVDGGYCESRRLFGRRDLCSRDICGGSELLE